MGVMVSTSTTQTPFSSTVATQEAPLSAFCPNVGFGTRDLEGAATSNDEVDVREEEKQAKDATAGRRQLMDNQLRGSKNTLIPSVFRDASLIAFDSLVAFVDLACGAVVALSNFPKVVTGGRFFRLWCNFHRRFFPKKPLEMHYHPATPYSNYPSPYTPTE